MVRSAPRVGRACQQAVCEGVVATCHFLLEVVRGRKTAVTFISATRIPLIVCLGEDGNGVGPRALHIGEAAPVERRE